MMIADLLASGGELRLDQSESSRYEARVAAAIRFNKVPAGKQLVTSGRWGREYVVRLQDAPAWLHAHLDPVVVPSSLRKPHAVVIALQSENSNFRLDRSVRHRALLLVQALATEAERRGYDVKATKVTRDAYGYRHADTKDYFSVTVHGYSVGVSLAQIVERTPHEPTAKELADKARYEWTRIPKYDAADSDRLSFKLSGFHEHRQSKWSDSATHALEDYLAQILQEIELRGAAAERKRLEAIREADERRRRREIALEEAKVKHREAYRTNVLHSQVEQWLFSQQVRRYLDAMKPVVAAIADPKEAASATEWLLWCEASLLTQDPLLRRIAMPSNPTPTPQDLQAYLSS
jgi:hypothetical protein